MKFDIITCHPKDIFYPLWIEQINRDRHLFDKVIIIMTQQVTERDYTKLLRNYIKEPLIIKKYYDDGKDWRNSATNEALNYSYSSHVLFLEQDFLVSKGFFSKLLDSVGDNVMIGTKDTQETNRYHPACLLIEKEALNKTSKNFSVTPDVGDHFSKFTSEMQNQGKCNRLEDMDLPEWFHIAGLTHNYRLNANYYQPQQFYTYMACSLKFKQPEDWRMLTHDKMVEIMHDYKMLLPSGQIELDKKIKSFFDEYETRSTDNVD